MSIVILRLPDVKRNNKIRPQKCRYCQEETFQRWSQVHKPVRDSRYRSVQVYRYRCWYCRRSFRHYPEGVDRADQTRLLRRLVVLFWVLGLSLRGAASVLSAFGVKLSHMTVWRDLQEQVRLFQTRRHIQPVAIAQVDEANPWAVKRFLEPLVKRLGISVIFTDDLGIPHGGRETGCGAPDMPVPCAPLGGPQPGRAAPNGAERMAVGARRSQGLAGVAAAGRQSPLVRAVETDPRKAQRAGSTTLAPQPIAGFAHPLERTLTHLSGLCLGQAGAWTNNGTEQAIGRMKMRSRTVRGCKSWPVIWAALMLAGLVWPGEMGIVRRAQRWHQFSPIHQPCMLQPPESSTLDKT